MARGVGGIGPANIMKHMKGIKFPATREDLLKLVDRGLGPDTAEVRSVVEKMSDREYSSVAEIMKEIGRIE